MFGLETFVERLGDDVLAPLAAAAHGRIVVVRADGPDNATRVRLMAVESGRSVLHATNPGRPDVSGHSGPFAANPVSES